MADALILITAPSIIAIEYPEKTEQYQGYINMFAGIGLTMGPVVSSVVQFWF